MVGANIMLYAVHSKQVSVSYGLTYFAIKKKNPSVNVGCVPKKVMCTSWTSFRSIVVFLFIYS